MSNEQPLISRIREMEARYDELTRVLGELDVALDQYLDFKSELDALREYMESGQWQKDFEADEAGQVPADLKREVLSEDGLYDLLHGADVIIARAKELS